MTFTTSTQQKYQITGQQDRHQNSEEADLSLYPTHFCITYNIRLWRLWQVGISPHVRPMPTILHQYNHYSLPVSNIVINISNLAPVLRHSLDS
jgi:hypothetical protein